MGYACPVCSDPQADAGHLANHLAFTAMLGDDEHEAWLDEHAPDWGGMGESELAETVSERIEETDFPQVFDDTVGGLGAESNDPAAERSGALFDGIGHGHEHTHGNAERPRSETSAPVDDETADVLEAAREMTKRMRGEVDDSE